jgi:hypothetical protein
MRRPTSARDCALETRTPPLTEVSWHRNIGRKRHQRLRGLEGCLLPVATANALGMALVEFPNIFKTHEFCQVSKVVQLNGIVRR